MGSTVFFSSLHSRLQSKEKEANFTIHSKMRAVLLFLLVALATDMALGDNTCACWAKGSGFLLSIKYTKEWTTVQPDIPQTIISLHNSNAIAVAFAKHKAKHILRNEYGKYCVIHRLQNSLKFLQMEDVKI